MTQAKPAIFLSALAIFLVPPLVAQDVAPLIREKPAVQVRVTKPGETPQGEPGRVADLTREPPPDPETVIVSMVNRHTITRAQLDRRVRARLGGAAPHVVGQMPPPASELLLEDLSAAARTDLQILDLQDEFEFEDAIREEEGRVLAEWMDQMMLADEARRHGFIISDEEFQDSLNQVKNEFRLTSREVQGVLDSMGMSDGELEGYLYDAILIEKLLARFVRLNYDDAYLHTQYEKRPDLYYTPKRYEIAHFTISLVGNESSNYVEELEEDAEGIRKRLRDGEDPEVLFEEINRLEYGFFGAVTTWDLNSPQLHPAVKQELPKLKEGQVSGVVTAYRREGTLVLPESFHILKLIRTIPAAGDTFETALPRLRELAQEAARGTVLTKIVQARTHKRVMNLRGISPDRLQKAAAAVRSGPPVDLEL